MAGNCHILICDYFPKPLITMLLKDYFISLKWVTPVNLLFYSNVYDYITNLDFVSHKTEEELYEQPERNFR